MIRHSKILRRGDTATAAVVPKVSDWHDTHHAPEWLIHALHGHRTNDELSTAEVETEYGYRGEGYPSAWRTRFDFSAIDEVCVEIHSPFDHFSLRGEFRAQYSVDEGVSWAYFDGISGPRVDVSFALHYQTVLRGEWITVAAAAKRDVLIRFVSMLSDGNAIMPGSISLWGR